MKAVWRVTKSVMRKICRTRGSDLVLIHGVKSEGLLIDGDSSDVNKTTKLKIKTKTRNSKTKTNQDQDQKQQDQDQDHGR